MEEIIKRIEQERIRMSLNKRQMSQACDITPEYYSQIINGKTSPNYKIIEAMAKVVGFRLVLAV